MVSITLIGTEQRFQGRRLPRSFSSAFRQGMRLPSQRANARRRQSKNRCPCRSEATPLHRWRNNIADHEQATGFHEAAKKDEQRARAGWGQVLQYRMRDDEIERMLRLPRDLVRGDHADLRIVCKSLFQFCAQAGRGFAQLEFARCRVSDIRMQRPEP